MKNCVDNIVFTAYYYMKYFKIRYPNNIRCQYLVTLVLRLKNKFLNTAREFKSVKNMMIASLNYD